jgi:uncharacterized cupin superfamily protein
VNLRNCEVSVRDALASGFEHRRVSVREALGGEVLGCSVYEFDPGKQLWPYHYHHGNEEWLIVISGTPTLRTPEGERELRAGDIASFVEGEAGAHTLYNRSSEPARVAIFSTLRRGNVVYPDSDKVGAAGLYFRRSDAVDYWEGETPGA